VFAHGPSRTLSTRITHWQKGLGVRGFLNSKRRVVVIEHYHIVFRESIPNAMFGKCDTHSGVPFGIILTWHDMGGWEQTFLFSIHFAFHLWVSSIFNLLLPLPSHSSPFIVLRPRPLGPGLPLPFPIPHHPHLSHRSHRPLLLLSGMAGRPISTKTDGFGVSNGLASCERLPSGVAMIVLLC